MENVMEIVAIVIIAILVVVLNAKQSKIDKRMQVFVSLAILILAVVITAFWGQFDTLQKVTYVVLLICFEWSRQKA